MRVVLGVTSPLTEFEVNAILDFKSEFEKPMRELLPILSSCDDGCPNTHYGKVVHETDETGESNVPRKGHSMLCFIDSDCNSRLRILRLASTHYPSLRSFCMLFMVLVTAISKSSSLMKHSAKETSVYS